MEQAAQVLESTFKNSLVFMLNFVKSKKFIAQHDLETQNKTFKAIDFKMKMI